jgi:hypothetical protein
VLLVVKLQQLHDAPRIVSCLISITTERKTWQDVSMRPAEASHSAAGPIARPLNCLDVEKTPAQRRHDDQNHGDRAQITERLSSRCLLPHFSDHLEFPLKLLPYDLQSTLLATLCRV